MGVVSSLNLLGKSLKISKNIFLQSVQVKKQMPYIFLLLEMGSLPIEIMAMEMVVEYLLKFQKTSSHQLPRIA